MKKIETMRFALTITGTLLFSMLYAQSGNTGNIHGNFQMDTQYYNPDSAIGAPPVPEKMLMNSFADFDYNIGNFSAGVRFESYLNVLQGFDARYTGNGVPYRYVEYKTDGLDVTVGNYYEQFGSGLIFRSYREPTLGIDNAMDGVRLRYNPYHGIYLKGIIGKQRTFFSEGSGIVRGFDGELDMNDIFKKLESKKTKVVLGGSFVSKYQADNDPLYVLPENVGASAGRFNITHGGFNINSEYAYKINDPSTINGYIYRPGHALVVMSSYAKKGFAFSLSGKRIDNMSFKSDRTATGNILNINYLPALTETHTYELMAFYPYATQPNGEMGWESQLIYTFKRGSKLGGHYGTDLTFNYAGANSLDTTNLNDMNTSRLGYKSPFFSVGKETYFRDFFVKVHHKFSKKFKLNLMYAYQAYNKNVVQGRVGFSDIYSNIGVVDFTYKFTYDHALHIELQHLLTREDMGNWAAGLAEYTMGSHWFIDALDEYNYGNPDPALQIHYFVGSFGYIRNATRITLGYGKQRAGIFCVGGVCRNVPASNGATLSITSSF